MGQAPYFLWVEVVCAECATTGYGRFVTKAPPRILIAAEAKRQGWKTFHPEGDKTVRDWHCPDCAARVGKGEA